MAGLDPFDDEFLQHLIDFIKEFEFLYKFPNKDLFTSRVLSIFKQNVKPFFQILTDILRRSNICSGRIWTSFRKMIS